MKESSDDSVAISDLKGVVKDFCRVRNWDKYHSPKELSIGISTEAAELLELFRFKSEKDMKKLLADKKTRKKIEDELSDIVFFCLRFAQMNNVDIATCFQRKMMENEKKYPVAKSKGSNKKYNELLNN